MDNNLITELFNLKKQKESIDSNIESLNEESKKLDEEITKKSAILLLDVLNEDIKEYKVPDQDIVVTLCSNKSIAYTDETKVLEYLVKNYPSLVKVTYKISKKDVNKVIKDDNTLKKALEDFTEEKVTQYVVVTTSENTQKMKEHISENKSKGNKDSKEEK